MGLGGVKRAVLLDALGTIVELPPPVRPLVEELARLGVTVEERVAGRALWAEMTYYREHIEEAADALLLADLRARCTEILRRGLGDAVRDVPAADLQRALLGALRFRAYPDVPAALAELRSGGVRIVVVSNWDVSLDEALERTGLAPLVDGAVNSAAVGFAKPDRRIFAAALELAGVDAADALFAGDSLEADVRGAHAAGIDAVLVKRDGDARPVGVRTIRSLAELPALAG